MKKILKIFISLVLLIFIISCSSKDNKQSEEKVIEEPKYMKIISNVDTDEEKIFAIIDYNCKYTTSRKADIKEVTSTHSYIIKQEFWTAKIKDGKQNYDNHSLHSVEYESSDKNDHYRECLYDYEKNINYTIFSNYKGTIESESDDYHNQYATIKRAYYISSNKEKTNIVFNENENRNEMNISFIQKQNDTGNWYRKFNIIVNSDGFITQLEYYRCSRNGKGKDKSDYYLAKYTAINEDINISSSDLYWAMDNKYGKKVEDVIKEIKGI